MKTFSIITYHEFLYDSNPNARHIVHANMTPRYHRAGKSSPEWLALFLSISIFTIFARLARSASITLRLLFLRGKTLRALTHIKPLKYDFILSYYSTTKGHQPMYGTLTAYT